ncbi:MAG: twin-arginine translocation signal domain-containing protein, partial [Gemmatimonadetes bacterium]|nr:twin-arginine translocation signal domain-containing protein [Gemmatimonadota bacterium]
MQRRDFLKTAALGAAATAVPGPALTLPKPAPTLHRA